MIRDEDLKQAIDYSEGQKEAAYSVLGEIANLLSSFFRKHSYYRRLGADTALS